VFSGRRRRQRAILAALAVLGIVLGTYAYALQLFDSSLQAVTYDTFITNAPARVSNQVTIVALDDSTLATYGRYPLPRQAYVDLLRHRLLRRVTEPRPGPGSGRCDQGRR